MTPAHMRSFYAVALRGSFTAGAKMLNISQPPVTKHVRELEEFYGVELFHRHSRGAEPTEVGRNLLAIVQRIVADQKEATDYLREVGSLQTGHLRIGAVNPFQAAEILSRFSARYPKVSSSVTTGNSRALVDHLRAYRTDIGVIGVVDDMAELEALIYSRPEMMIIVNQNHLWASRRSIKIAELEDQPMVLRERGSETRRILEEAARKNDVTLNSSAEFSSREGLLAAVAHGLGVGAVAEDQLFDHKLLCKLRVRDAEMRTDVLVVCLKERSHSRIIQSFMECAKECAARSSGPNGSRG